MPHTPLKHAVAAHAPAQQVPAAALWQAHELNLVEWLYMSLTQRCTINAVPMTSTLLNKSKLPLVLVLTPCRSPIPTDSMDSC
ncbi:hypothetical protein DFH11DRAFT_1877127 [Phellopilus nigrolimitatus]|nr:hypothetical protein DFH11DRAFT_1877127 [Phellopilus nigrolimitatus]